MFDELRFAALKQGADAAVGTQYVTIQTRDLVWLLELVESQRAAPVRVPDTAELN
jgi:hypothetical protein